MLVNGNASYDIIDGNLVLKVDNPLSYLANQGFKLSSKVTDDVMNEVIKKVGEQPSLEDYKDKLSSLETKEGNILVKFLHFMKPQTKVNDKYHNAFDFTMIEPEMPLRNIVMGSGLDSLLVKKEVDEETQKRVDIIEAKKKKLIDGGYMYKDKPHHVIKYQKYNEELMDIFNGRV